MHFENSLTILASLTFMAVSMGLIMIAIRSVLLNSRRLEERLAGGAVLEGEGNGGIASSRKKANLLTQLGSHLTLPDAKEITRLRFMLGQAGYYDQSSVKTFLAVRLVSLFGPVLFALLLWGPISAKLSIGGAVLTILTIAAIGLFAPTWFVRWKIKKRTDQCRRGFPDMMDLMVACIEAGLGLDAALVRVSHELGGRYPALKINLEIMNLELRAGRNRHEAMLNFANRINLEEAKALAVMLKQAEEMGSSIGQALRSFADEMRHKRMMRAEEKAMGLSAKLTVPLIMFIFPTIMIMLLLPAGIRMKDGLGL